MKRSVATNWLTNAALLIAILLSVRDASAKKLSYKELVPDVAKTGLSWKPPSSVGAITSVARSEAGNLLQAIKEQSPECYAYLAADGQTRPDSADVADTKWLPVLLTTHELAQSPSWSDWNRLGTTIGYFPRTRGTGIRAFLTVQLFSNRDVYLAYVPDGNDRYDLSKPPLPRVLTRPQMVEHWAELPRHRVSGLERDRIVWLMFGFSPKNFKLGETSSKPASAEEVAYFLGSAYLLNPYAAITAGWMTEDGKRFRLGFGLNLDIGIVTAIFK